METPCVGFYCSPHGRILVLHPHFARALIITPNPHGPPPSRSNVGANDRPGRDQSDDDLHYGCPGQGRGSDYNNRDGVGESVRTEAIPNP